MPKREGLAGGLVVTFVSFDPPSPFINHQSSIIDPHPLHACGMVVPMPVRGQPWSPARTCRSASSYHASAVRRRNDDTAEAFVPHVHGLGSVAPRRTTEASAMGGRGKLRHCPCGASQAFSAQERTCVIPEVTHATRRPSLPIHQSSFIDPQPLPPRVAWLSRCPCGAAMGCGKFVQVWRPAPQSLDPRPSTLGPRAPSSRSQSHQTRPLFV